MCCYAAVVFTATTTHFKRALPQDHVEKIPCPIMFLIPDLCMGFQGRLERSCVAEILTYTKTSVPIIHSVYTTLLAIITITRASNMLPTVSSPVSLISPNDHCMPHATTTSRNAVGWMKRWPIPGALIVIKHKNVKTAHHDDLYWCNSIPTAKQQQ